MIKGPNTRVPVKTSGSSNEFTWRIFVLEEPEVPPDKNIGGLVVSVRLCKHLVLLVDHIYLICVSVWTNLDALQHTTG